jgi:glycosyltransferase involved in cell wall biosynthesis
MSRVLVLASEHVGREMAGPAIRAYELARVLAAAGHRVTLGAPSIDPVGDGALELVVADRATVNRLAGPHDAILLQGWVLERFPALADAGTPLVVDLYDPFGLELLSLLDHRPAAERDQAQAAALRALVDQLRAGDFFLCASEQQRDYWLGWLDAAGRVNRHTHDADRSLRELIDVVPFGVPAAPPAPRARAMRGVLPGVGRDDVVVLWGGGVYNWFDPATLVRAVARVAASRPALRLVFMTDRHPNPAMPPMRAVEEARRAAEELGVAGGHVVFNPGWVAYESRADWLAESDIGASTHRDSVEARFSFRTRILDYLWAGLPVVCTAGDALAGEVQARELGAAVPPGDVDALAAALTRLASDPQLRAECGLRARQLAATLTWEQVAAPLVRFGEAPRRAPDLAAGGPLQPRRDRRLSRRALAAQVRRIRGVGR